MNGEIRMERSVENQYVTAIEENLSAWIPVFGKLGQVFENNPAGVRRSMTYYPFSLFNSIMDTHLAPEQTDAAVQCVLSDARAHKVPVLWWAVPSTQPADLGKHLQDNGFRSADNDPGMAAELERLNEAPSITDDFSIQLAQNDTAWRQWGETIEVGFEIPSPSELRITAWSKMLHETDPNILLAYTGFLDEKPVATSLLFLAAGAAGIYAVSTIPEARRKGIGAWMTLYPLLQARARGYKIGVLVASKMGLGVYRSLGFQEYCKIASYLWAPE